MKPPRSIALPVVDSRSGYNMDDLIEASSDLMRQAINPMLNPGMGNIPFVRSTYGGHPTPHTFVNETPSHWTDYTFGFWMLTTKNVPVNLSQAMDLATGIWDAGYYMDVLIEAIGVRIAGAPDKKYKAIRYFQYITKQFRIPMARRMDVSKIQLGYRLQITAAPAVEIDTVLAGYLSPTRNAEAAKRFLGKALNGLKNWEQPQVINIDKAPSYGAAIADLKAEGVGEVRLINRQFGI